jgi:hypothetical protein
VTISDRDERRLRALEARIDRAETQAEQARQEWARLVREIGIAAVARRMGLTRQTLAERVRSIEARGR